MEKLIELLNEYAHTYADHYDDTGEEITIEFFSHTDECFQYACDGSYETLVDDVVISKRYWFIKWLIKKRKIDRDKFDERRDEWNKHLRITWVNDYELLLMLLVIQDKPIEFLISILKQHGKVMRWPIH